LLAPEWTSVLQVKVTLVALWSYVVRYINYLPIYHIAVGLGWVIDVSRDICEEKIIENGFNLNDEDSKTFRL